MCYTKKDKKQRATCDKSAIYFTHASGGGGGFMLHNIMLGSDGLSVGICTGRHDIHIPVNE